MAGKKGRTTSKARLRATDISSVEAGLETLQRETITIGTAVAEQPDAALFFVDQRGVQEPADLRALKERGLLLKRPLRIDEILKPQSKVAALGPAKPVPAAPSKGERVLLERKVKTLLAAKKSAPKSASTAAEREEIFDPWADGEQDSKRPIRKTAAPVVRVRAVKVPVGGASYRPDPREHGELVETVKSAEQKRLEALARIRAQLPSPAPSPFSIGMVDVLIDPDQSPSGDEGQGETESLSGAEGAAAGSEAQEEPAAEAKKPKVSRRKTEGQRKWEKQHKERQTVEAALKLAAEKEAELEQAEALAAQVGREIKEHQATVAARRRRQREIQRTNPRVQLNRLGTYAFAPAPLLATPAEEMGECLRRVKVEGNLVLERFKSLQERALIEPIPRSIRSAAKRSGKKLKYFEPRSYQNS